MKKRIVSMILALSMMLSILPVSAFADAGARVSSAAEETNSITYGSVGEHEDVGRNSETNNQVVKIKTGANGLPKAASGTGWSYDETAGLTITGVKNRKTEYVLDGTVSCNVTVKNVTDAVVYLLDGTVTRGLRINADNRYGVYVLGGSYADVELNEGTVDGGTYDKLTENGGYVQGGYFRDISGLSTDTQQQAHQLLLPENCTLNGRKETGDIYIVKKYDYFGTGNDLKLVVESATGCEGWAVATTSSNGGVMTLPAGVTDYNFTYNGNVIAKISISADGRTLSASFSMIPMSGNAPMKLVTIQSMSKELSFTNEGLPDLTGVTCVESLDEGENKCQAYLCRNWTYVCYPNMPNLRGVLMMADQGGREIDLKALSPAPINCAVQLTNATVTDAAFGEKGALVLTSGKITGGTYPEARVGISTTDGTGKVEITGGVFDSLSCYGECTISNAVILDCTFSTFFDNSKFAVSDTVFGALPDDLESALAAGQQISKLVVRNGNVTAINGRSLTLSTNTIYLVGAGTADITLDTDVLNINEEAVENYNANTSAAGKVLRITGNNDGKDILVNKSTDVGAVKPLRITSEGLPDLTDVEPKEITGGGMTITLYEGQGWKYGIMSGKDESGVQRTASQILITSPDGSPVDLTSREINPSQAALKSDGITLQDVTVTSMYADAPVELNNAVIESGYFQKEVTLDRTSTIAGGVFDATVKLRDNAKITAGVFQDIELPGYASEAAVIKNAVILGSLTGNNSKAAVSDTLSLSRIDSAYLAAGQQQSELRSMDGVMTDVNGNSVADVAAVYRIGDAALVLTFTKPVTNINGEPVSAYNGAQLSPDGKTLFLNGRNDGADIVVNQTGETTEKLPFKGFEARDFRAAENEDGTYTLTCNKEGIGKEDIGKLTFECKYITGENAGKALPVNTYPTQGAPYGRYQVVITAEEGEKYKAGSIVVSEGVVRYAPVAADFSYDAAQNEVTYKGKNYYDADPTSVTKMFAPEGTVNYNTAVPTAPGRYDVHVMVYEDANYYKSLTEKVGTYVVPEPTKPKYYYYWNAQEGKAHNEGDKITLSVDKQEGNNVIWKIEGLAEDAYTITDTGTHIELQFFMPSNDVRVTNRYEPIYYTLTVDGKEERRAFGKEVTFTAPEKGGHTFTGWEVDGVPEGTDTSKATITFTMPANNVTLTPQYKKNTYTLTVDGKDEPRVFDEDVTVIAQPVEGKTFTGWEVTGLPADVDTTKVTISFKMPANKVTLKAEYTENAPETYELKVTDAQVTLKDGGAVADLTTVPVGTELVATAPEKDGYTFTGWEKEGLPADANIDGATVTFKMPANNVTLKAQYTENAPETYELKVTNAKVTLKDGSAVADLTAVPAGTELVATAPEKEGYTFTGWTATGLPANAKIDGATVTFKMPANKVTLNAKYIANAPETYELKVTDAKVTLKDGGAVADLTAVRVGTELVATAPEKDGYTFTGWEVTGLPADVDTTKATITFKMPANNVTLTPQYEKNTYTLTVDGVDEPRVFDENVTVTAPEKEGCTFTGWEVDGVPEGTDTTKATITFKMPANNVTLTPQYEKNTYTLTVNGKPEQRTFGEEVTLTARKPEGMTFSHWEIKKGLAADAVDINSETITFTMPANDVEISAIYNKVPTPDPDPETKTHKLNVLSAQIFLKDGSDVANLEAVPVGTELKAIAYEDTETEVFKCWTGLELTEEQSTARVLYFTMPDHDVNLVAEFVTPTKPEPKTYELKVTDAKVTLKDGGAVADLKAVPAGTELKATADEDTETSVFKNWSCTGLELTEEQRTAREMYFTMPDHDVNLVAEFVTPTKPEPKTYELKVTDAKVTLKDGGAVADLKAVPAGTELKATADEDTETSVFKNWNCTGLELTEEQRTARVVEFTMPDHDVELTAVFKVPATPDPDPTPAPGGDGGGAAIVAVAAVGGAAIGVGAYIAGTTAYLKSVLPEGMAIPANRQQLAVALWTAAGKPATQSTALFNDVAADAAELQAIRWVVETGLMTAQDGNFKPGSRVSRLEVIRTWKNYQQRG